MASRPAAGQNSPKDDYFRGPGVLWTVLVPMGMALVTVSAFAPHLVPYSYMGPLGSLVKFLVVKAPTVLQGTAGVAWILHVGEAYYASVLCKSKNLSDESTTKWMASVFVYGIFSLKHLLAYKGKDRVD